MQKWFLPNRKDLTGLYLPRAIEVPRGEPKALVFLFDNVPAFATDERSLAVSRPVVLWGMTANDSQAAGFRVQIFHQYAGGKRQVYAKHQPQALALGTAQRPTVLKSGYLIDAQENLTVEVKNLANAAARIEVVLFGVEPA
jgi:hypothetical protein